MNPEKPTMKWVANQMPQSDDSKELALMAPEAIEKARQFHRSFPQYQPTPLTGLPHLARHFGVGGVYVKDESFRFGLNAFKVLGGSFAMARFIAKQTGRDISELGYRELTSPDVKKDLGEFTFYTATDGNHGRGVAWAANQIGQKSVVYMPKGSSQTRLENIRAENATATITDMNYDDAVRLATAESAKTPNSVVIQDTAWEGYEEIPGWIMQGYATMASEAGYQLKAAGVDRPTHIFVQAGVGSLAGAVTGFFKNLYPDNPPTIVVVEAEAADCLYRSAMRGDGSYEKVGGDLTTIMAGLACGEPNTISWNILRNEADFFISLPDYAAARAMRILAVPLTGDAAVISGESGAAGIGALIEALSNPKFEALKQALKLDKHSEILAFSTEGNTDPDWFRKIVWDGDFPTPSTHYR
ncbi:diaminopropionate ammonia-lyase [Ruminococcaceae bacterium OttesenSCG-928-D13]|nr:diaminopropionate ammonia-lyase [Ruminococcaceae bacterium OttesenSCG-928-D13]